MFNDDVPQVFVGLADVHALDGLGCLTGVLVGQDKKPSSVTAEKKKQCEKKEKTMLEILPLEARWI